MQAWKSGIVPVEAIHHFQLPPEFLFGEVVKHASIHQWLHEVTAILWQTQAGQPVIADPLVIHITVGQNLEKDNFHSELKYTWFRKHLILLKSYIDVEKVSTFT